jgi:hypothetical protein
LRSLADGLLFRTVFSSSRTFFLDRFLPSYRARDSREKGLARDMWATFFRDGGWGMYPTALFGFLLVASGFLYLLRPESRFAPIVVCAGVLTLGAGLLGTSVGVVKTFHYLPEVAASEQLPIAALGCAESLNNLVLALILVVASTLLVGLGVVRSVRVPAERG